MRFRLFSWEVRLEFSVRYLLHTEWAGFRPWAVWRPRAFHCFSYEGIAAVLSGSRTITLITNTEGKANGRNRYPGWRHRARFP